MGKKAVWLVAGIYLLYVVIYVNGRDGENDYFWVNNGFFFGPLLMAAALVTIAVFFIALRDYTRRPADDRNLRVFASFLVCFVLTVLFLPFAIAVTFVDYASS